jgi:hypothetical protein
MYSKVDEGNMWDGKERRRGDGLDHDLLIEIKTIVNSNGSKLDDFITETKSRLSGHDKDIKFTNQVIYGLIGAFVLVEFILKVFK